MSERAEPPRRGWHGTGSERDELAELFGEAPRWLEHVAALERGAGQVWSFEPLVVPGLLQTPEYAVAVESSGPDALVPGAVGARVELRLSRQEVLGREPDPLRLAVVIDESVLYRVAGDAAVMAGQLDRLVAEAARPNVDLRVLPLAAGHFSADFGFTVLADRRTAQPFLAYVYDFVGAHYLDRPDDVAVHRELFAHLAGVALAPAASIELIERVAAGRYRRPVRSR